MKPTGPNTPQLQLQLQTAETDAETAQESRERRTVFFTLSAPRTADGRVRIARARRAETPQPPRAADQKAVGTRIMLMQVHNPWRGAA